MTRKSDYYFKKYVGIFIGIAIVLALIDSSTAITISPQIIALLSVILTGVAAVVLEFVLKKK